MLQSSGFKPLKLVFVFQILEPTSLAESLVLLYYTYIIYLFIYATEEESVCMYREISHRHNCVQVTRAAPRYASRGRGLVNCELPGNCLLAKGVSESSLKEKG